MRTEVAKGATIPIVTDAGVVALVAVPVAGAERVVVRTQQLQCADPHIVAAVQVIAIIQAAITECAVRLVL